MFSVPNEQKQFSQPNDGDAFGNLFATYNLDLKSNKGRMRVGEGVRKAFTNADNADFDGYAAQIVTYTGGTGGIFAISGKAFSTADETPTSGWAQASTSGEDPDGGNTVADATVFDGLLLVSGSATSGTQDILAWNGTTWSSWWKTTLSQTGFATGHRTLLRVGADGNLYLTVESNKLYKVTPTPTVSVSGAGTLDFSATPHTFECMETSSNRLWIGTQNDSGEAIVIEWDMAPNSISANRLHKVGCKAVWAIAIWNDVPYAVCSDGKLRAFNGSGFEVVAQFPSGEKLLEDEYVHPNGWAIIDGLPHFLTKGGEDNGNNTYTRAKGSNWYFPAGVYCYDPAIGIYHRFAIGAGASTQEDYGQHSIKYIGALYALDDPDTKFLASYEYYTDTAGTAVSILAYHDRAKTKPVRAFFATPPIDTLTNPLKAVKTIHKRLGAGDQINLYYRTREEDSTILDGTWSNATAFHTTDTATDVSEGDVALFKIGPGAGQLRRIAGKETSTNVTVLTFADTDFVAADDTSTLEVLNFKHLGTIDGQAEWKEVKIPSAVTGRSFQLLVEIVQAAGNKQELDYCIIS